MPIKLLAADLDGTLVADLHTIPARTQTAIKTAVQRGVVVIIATGREYETARQFANLLGLTGPIICHQGAMIYDAETGKLIASETLPVAAANHLVDLSRAMKLALGLYFDGDAYTECLTPQSNAFFSNVGTTMTQVDDLKQVINREPIKGMIVHPAQEGEAILSQLQAGLNGSLKVFRSLDILTEITLSSVSKGHALARLAAHYGIAQSDVMAIGDQDNDVDMITWAGIGVAMGDASPRAKAAADYIAPPLAEDGAAWAVEHFILEQG